MRSPSRRTWSVTAHTPGATIQNVLEIRSPQRAPPMSYQHMAEGRKRYLLAAPIIAPCNKKTSQSTGTSKGCWGQGMRAATMGMYATRAPAAAECPYNNYTLQPVGDEGSAANAHHSVRPVNRTVQSGEFPHGLKNSIIEVLAQCQL